LKIVEGFDAATRALSRQGTAPGSEADEREASVRSIIESVRKQGDKALFEYTEKYDHAKLAVLEVDNAVISRACCEVDAGLIDALKTAADRITAFHHAQLKGVQTKVKLPGLSQVVRPLDRVGVYVPGGTASYPSTVLMTAIPARVAGVGEIILVTPPRPDGTVSPLVLAAALIAGVDRVFSVGGAQAIAALAYGTESIPRVDKICGPGNIFVTLAKKLVYGVVGIDGLAGPSEVLILADKGANPAYCAADILAQAEHDAMSSAILVTDSMQLAVNVKREVEQQLENLLRREIAERSLESNGVIAVVDSPEEMIELANAYAPEHLCLMVNKPAPYLEYLKNAGCIIMGKKATVVIGDYVAGPSHVLPTSGTARFSSPLNVLDFIKITNVIDVDEVAINELGPAALIIADAEGFGAHGDAVQQRMTEQI
jgi:histidinol dehydrogenase